MAATTVGVAEVVLVSAARPFTVLADVVVSIALVAMVAVVVVQRSARPEPAAIARRPIGTDQLPDRALWWPWAALLALITAWELGCLVGSPRADHPTFSYFLDLVTIHPAGRVVAFIGWLALGGYLVTR